MSGWRGPLALALAATVAPACRGTASVDRPAAHAVVTSRFTTVVPDGWEVLADDVESMGLMTLAETGTGGRQGVYLKVEGAFDGDARRRIEVFSDLHGGSAPHVLRRNGVDWVGTTYTVGGRPQTLRIAARPGSKVTVTVMGRDYDEDPGVRAIFDALTLR